MKRLKENLIRGIKGVSLAGFRFPMAVVSLLAAALVVFGLIMLNYPQPLMLQKLRLTFFVGTVLGIAVQFVVERFHKLSKKRGVGYGAALLLLLGYFLILLPAPEMNREIVIRSLVVMFALTCIILWVPSYRSEVNFNLTALIHFKSSFTSLLYSGVLTVGITAIIGTVDVLLFEVPDNIYVYTMTVVWVVFAPIYYLSLLPKFNSESGRDESMTERVRSYPKFLAILVTHIATPLISVYTLVLFIYFLKILFTLTWPSGEVASMGFVYAIGGLLVFVLSGLLENRLGLLYRKLFPKMLIPVAIMQLISVGIRLNTYGVTESRYYMAIFGVIFIIVGVTLSFSKGLKNEHIALVAAIFSLISIIPPVDAFTVSRYSQINRIESILENEGMLVDGKIIKKEGTSDYAKVETSNILQYLSNRDSLKYIDWLPENFKIHKDFKEVFGFESNHYYNTNGDRRYFSVSLNERQPLPVSGYDVLLSAASRKYMNEELESIDFEFEGKAYELQVNKSFNEEVRVSILDALGKELIGTALNAFVEGLVNENNETQETLSPGEMSFDVINNAYKLRIIFQNINYIVEGESHSEMDYKFYVLFAEPR